LNVENNYARECGKKEWKIEEEKKKMKDKFEGETGKAMGFTLWVEVWPPNEIFGPWVLHCGWRSGPLMKFLVSSWTYEMNI